MRITRIYYPGSLSEGEIVELDDSASGHVTRVLRLQAGAALRVFNGRGGEYDAVVEVADPRRTRLRVGARADPATESALRVTLAQGVSRGERMDYTLQKAVELGVTGIVPLITEFCQVRLDGARLERRRQHWQGVIRSACEQSGRTRLPELGEVSALPRWLAAAPVADDELRLVLDPDGDQALGEAGRDAPRQVTLVAGPEGGLSERELAAAAGAGFHRVRLGPRILRTETAGIAALTALQLLWGDLGR